MLKYKLRYNENLIFKCFNPQTKGVLKGDLMGLIFVVFIAKAKR